MSGTVRDQLRIGPIEAVSPTLAELLRTCKLRAGLSRAEGASNFALGNPKAWLGTAYHEVLAAAGDHSGNDLDKVITVAWEAAINREYRRAETHPLDKRFGDPKTWPSYHLVAAMVRLRAQELARAQARLAEEAEGTERARAGPRREQRFSGAGGKLVGRPDVVRADEIVDFKSGDVHGDGHQEQVRPSYARQLRLYAFLVKEALGWWPRKGILVPMVGAPVEVEIDPQACEQEANEAVCLLEDYNTLILKGRDCSQLANPSSVTCRWCPFQTICPAFWDAVAPDWENELGTVVVIGAVHETPQAIYCGAALSLAIEVQGGTEGVRTVMELAPLNSETHPMLKRVQRGDQVRVTGLLRRPDGTVRMTERTTLVVVRDLPSITIQAIPPCKDSTE